MSLYELRQELHGHTGDVRCACILRSDGSTLVTGSRDRSIRLWKQNAQGEYELGIANFDHPHWVNAVQSLVSGFATGCHDHIVRIFDNSCNLLASLGGHTGPVSSLSLLEGGTRLASGSWDGSARVWDLNSKSCVQILANHENIVCVLGLPGGFLATGSTGMQQGNAVVGFKVRLYSPTSNEPIQIVQPHEGPIRCLSKCSNSDLYSFASASNDGSVVLYTLGSLQPGSTTVDIVNKLVNPPGFEGTPAFNFCVQDLPFQKDFIVTASDDGCARIWNTGSSSVFQEIEHPATVWWVTALPNGDLCTCSGDGMVRLFSSDPIRQCSDESVVRAFRETAKASREAQKKKISPPMDVSRLQRIQEATPGASDQQVKVFNKDGVAVAYQWSAVMGTWIEIGVVTSGSGDGPEGKTELDGQYYDKVVPVEIEDVRTAEGGLMKLKLGFNNTDNPYVVANAFVKKHELPDHYVEEIVQFINQQKSSSGVPTVTQQQQQMPPSQSVAPILVKRSDHFPLRDNLGILFEKGDPDKAVAKIKEQNAANQVLNEKDLFELDAILGILKATSRYHATQFSDVQMALLLSKLANAWALNERFPVYDLIRAVLTHPDGGAKLGGKRGEQFFAQACNAACSSGASQPLILTTLRAASNMFRYPQSNLAALTACCETATSPIECLSSSALVRDSNVNIRSALGTLFLNVANALLHRKGRMEGDLAALAQCLRGASVLLSSNPVLDDEGAFRAASAIGCVALVDPQLITDAVRDVLSKSSGERVKQVCLDVLNVI